MSKFAWVHGTGVSKGTFPGDESVEMVVFSVDAPETDGAWVAAVLWAEDGELRVLRDVFHDSDARLRWLAVAWCEAQVRLRQSVTLLGAQVRFTEVDC